MRYDHIPEVGLFRTRGRQRLGVTSEARVGDIPLTEDGSAEAPGTMVWNLNLGYRYRAFKIAMEVFNLFDSGDHDITYFYASRLPGEPAGGIEDIHFHPLEPRQFRFSLSYAW